MTTITPDVEALAAEQEAIAALGRTPTWRYIGDRAAADQAYRLRFGVAEAPEPIAFRGMFAYTLPNT